MHSRGRAISRELVSLQDCPVKYEEELLLDALGRQTPAKTSSKSRMFINSDILGGKLTHSWDHCEL